jgi:hypothetical protein
VLATLDNLELLQSNPDSSSNSEDDPVDEDEDSEKEGDEPDNDSEKDSDQLTEEKQVPESRKGTGKDVRGNETQKGLKST